LIQVGHANNADATGLRLVADERHGIQHAVPRLL
jgi:hypothetical protein